MGCLEDLAFCLDAFVDILDLLVELVRLGRQISGIPESGRTLRTMATQSECHDKCGVWWKTFRTESRDRISVLWQWLPEGR